MSGSVPASPVAPEARLARVFDGPVADEDVTWLKRPEGYLAALAGALRSGDDGLLDPNRHLLVFDELDNRSQMGLGAWPSERAQGLLRAARLIGGLAPDDAGGARQSTAAVTDLRAVVDAFTQAHEPRWSPPSRLRDGPLAEMLAEALRHQAHAGLVAAADLRAALSSAPAADARSEDSIELMVLISRHRHGEAATLRVRAAHGPPGLFADVAAQPFTRFDAAFGDALQHAYLAAGAPSRSLRWSLADARGWPYDEVVGPSIGLGAAVAVQLLATGSSPPEGSGAAFTGAVDPEGNVLTLLEDDAAEDLSTYHRKLEAAGRSRVIFPALDAKPVARRRALYGLTAELDPVATVDDARARLVASAPRMPQKRRWQRGALAAVLLLIATVAVVGWLIARPDREGRPGGGPSAAGVASSTTTDPLAALRETVRASVLQVTPPASSPAGPFGILRTEVEAGWYAACVDGGACRYGGSDSGHYLRDRLRPSWPATVVNAPEAAQFCEWLGGRLPQREEWQAAVLTIGRGEWPMPLFPDGNVGPVPSSDPRAPTAIVSASDDGERSSSEAVFLVGNAQELTATTCDASGQACLPWAYPRAQASTVQVMGVSPQENAQAGPSGPAMTWWTGDRVDASARQADVGFRCAFDLGAGAATGPASATGR